MIQPLKVLLVLAAVAVCTVKSVTFGQLCESNTLNILRGCDSKGCGYYGAPRGSRTHNGIDIKCDPGMSVYAPFPGTILRRSRPYANDNGAYNNGLYISGSGTYAAYKAKIWYFIPSATSGSMTKGQDLGTSQTLTTKYVGIMDHLHIQVYKNGVIIDPTHCFDSQGC